MVDLHNQHLLGFLISRVLVVADGRVAFMGNPEQALDFFKTYVDIMS